MESGVRTNTKSGGEAELESTKVLQTRKHPNTRASKHLADHLPDEASTRPRDGTSRSCSQRGVGHGVDGSLNKLTHSQSCALQT